MKIVVAGKGGVGKTTVSGTIARAFARAGHDVLALDADTNPMLGVSLGVGPEETDLLVAVRQGLETGETEHEKTTEGFVERFGRDAPDGVRLVVASRIEQANPGCMCCGVSPEGLLRELESEGKIIIGDLEAGIGTVMRLQEGQADIILIVAQPTAKSLNIAAKAVELSEERGAQMIVVANRVRDDEDLAVIRAAVGDDVEMVIVPDEPAIAQADREGRAAIDVDDNAPGVRVLIELANRLAGMAVAAA